MRVIKSLIILLLLFNVLFLGGCLGQQAPSQDSNLNTVIEQQIAGMKVGEKKEISIGNKYDSILVIPPYSSEKNLKDKGLTADLIKGIAKQMTPSENPHFFVIENNKIKNWTVLNSEYGTLKDEIIKVIYPSSIKVERISGDYRPLQIIE